MSRARHHAEHEGKKEHRAKGGRVGMVAAGNPDVIKEAEGEEPYDRGDERKRGGKVKKKKHGGKVHEMHAEGEKSKHRMDRPKRASGGRVGSDRNPFSSAHKGGAAGEKVGHEPD